MLSGPAVSPPCPPPPYDPSWRHGYPTLRIVASECAERLSQPAASTEIAQNCSPRAHVIERNCVNHASLVNDSAPQPNCNSLPKKKHKAGVVRPNTFCKTNNVFPPKDENQRVLLPKEFVESLTQFSQEGAVLELDRLDQRPVGGRQTTQLPPEGQQCQRPLPPEGQYCQRSLPPEGQYYQRPLPPEGQQCHQSPPPEGQQCHQSLPPEGQQCHQPPPPEGQQCHQPPPPEGQQCQRSPPLPVRDPGQRILGWRMVSPEEATSPLLEEVVINMPSNEGAFMPAYEGGPSSSQNGGPPSPRDPHPMVTFRYDAPPPRDEDDVAVTAVDPSQAGNVLLSNGTVVNVKDYLQQKNDMRISGRLWNTRCSILGHVIFCLCVTGIVLTILNLQSVNKLKSQDEDYCEDHQCNLTILLVVPLTVLLLILVFIYGCLMCEALISNTKLFTQDMQKAEEVVRHIQNRRLAPPKITIDVECWHYHLKQKKKVITYAQTVVFPISRCVDASGDIDPEVFKPGYVTRFQVNKEIGFLDEESFHALSETRQLLKEEFKGKDDFVTTSVVVHIPGCKPFMQVYVEGRKPTTCWNRTCYWLSSTFLLTLCYRFLYRMATRRTKYTYLKIVGV